MGSEEGERVYCLFGRQQAEARASRSGQEGKDGRLLTCLSRAPADESFRLEAEEDASSGGSCCCCCCSE